MDELIIPPEKAQQLLWERGVLSWKLHKAQLDIYEHFNSCKEIIYVINCSRRIGKTFLLCLIALEYALKHPNCSVAFVAPTAKQVKRNISPIIKTIIKDCPGHLKPRWKAQDAQYVFSNGSIIQTAGTDNDRAEDLRGGTYNLVLIDEAREIENLYYIVTSILVPTTLTVEGKVIMASTPPESSTHDFVDFVNIGKIHGNYIHKTIYDNPMITADKIAKYMQESGGADSTAWRREYLAEIITDPTTAVLPEFTEGKAKELVKEVVRPQYFDAYVALDAGFVDKTGVLFGYWNFFEAALVVEDELLLDYSTMTTKELARCISEKEQQLWHGKPPYARISDADLIIIGDLNREHNLTFSPARKDNREAAINNLRLLITENKLIIHPRCVNLIAQMRGAIWNKNKTDFVRSKTKGHFDLVSALIYMARNVHRQHNPVPPTLGLDINTMFIGPNAIKQTATARAFAQLFDTKRWFNKDDDKINH